jgi:hypothetical protein
MFGNTQMLKQHQKKTKYCLKIQEARANNEREEIVQERDKELTCNFCGKKFKNKYILDSHKKQAKYCLKIQESQNQEIVACLIICKFCGKNFSTASFNRHDSTCKKKNQALIEEIVILKMKAENAEEIAMLKMKAEIGSIYKESAERAQATIEEIAKQPTYQKNSTRNIQNNLNLIISSLTPLDLSQARVDSIIDEKYTKNDFYEGQKGAAHLIHKHLLTDSNGKPQIVCTDTERGTFHHIDLNGEHVVDYKNSHLIDKVHLPLKRKAGKFAAEESVKNPNAFKDILMNESSIRELETKPGLFNRTMAKLTGKNCAKQLIEQQSNLLITKEWLLENSKFLTVEHILRGPEGYADYALSYPLNNRLIIDDDYYDSEHKVEFLKYKDFNGDIIVDIDGLLLGKMIFDSLNDQKKKLMIEHETVDFNENSIFMEEFRKILMENI